jgi:hypothetical protein
MSSGHRAQNLLNLKIADSAPGFRDYLKLARVVESKFLIRARNKMFVAIRTHKSTTRTLRPVCLPYLIASYSVSIESDTTLHEVVGVGRFEHFYDLPTDIERVCLTQ